MLLAGGALVIVLLTLAAMWAPNRWRTRTSSPASSNGDDA
jgi:hypothetical protein